MLFLKNTMFYNSDIQKIEIEASSRCNARCPHCLRESRNGDLSFFKQVNLTKKFFEERLSKEFVKNLRCLSFVGVMGEPAMNKELPEIIKWFLTHNPDISIDICTNGGVQDTSWWIDIGNLLKLNGKVIFAVDGLEDTNHIYRINVKWNLLIENIKSYISTGAMAEWQFIPFKHNEHQIEECRSISKSLGFNNFFIKKSHRNLINQPQNKKNKVENSTNPDYTYSGFNLDFNDMISVENYLNLTNIDCFSIQISHIYISAEGLVYPCCHTAGLMQIPDDFLPKGYDWVKHANQSINKDEIDLHKNDIKDIIQSTTFTKIKNSWNKSMNSGKNPICSIICGKFNNNNSIKETILTFNKNQSL